VIGNKHVWVTVPGVEFRSGQASLELISPDPPVTEGLDGGGRQLGFALYGVRLD
jgi:hypothetical protein